MSKISVLTYNIDKREHNYQERLDAFIETVQKEDPDLIAVQEGTRLTYEIILRKLSGYKKFLPEQVRFRKSGEALFSKYPISETNFLPFPKATDKKGLTIAKVDVWGQKDLWLVTSQFDDNVTLKRDQIASIPKLLRNCGDIIIFAGDTRILEYQNDLTGPVGWFDAWYEAGNEEEKFSYNSIVNPLATYPLKDRPDRVWFYPDDSIDCISCRLVGRDSKVVVSSHYGVSAEFEFDETF